MVGKIFLSGVRFDIVYNNLFNENTTVFKTETEVPGTAVCHPTPIHVYLSSTNLHIQIIG